MLFFRRKSGKIFSYADSCHTYQRETDKKRRGKYGKKSEGRHSPGTCGEQENFLATVVEAEDIAADGGTASDYGIYL